MSLNVSYNFSDLLFVANILQLITIVVLIF